MKTRAQVADSLGISYTIATNKRPPRASVCITKALANKAGWLRKRARVWDTRAGFCRGVCVLSLLAASAGAVALAVGGAGALLVSGLFSISAVFLAGGALAGCWICEEMQNRAWAEYRRLMPNE